jgi:uncharacterized membrane protein YdfJ with MMPL/SSD domain
MFSFGVFSLFVPLLVVFESPIFVFVVVVVVVVAAVVAAGVVDRTITEIVD